MIIINGLGGDRAKDHAIPENFFVEIEYVGPIAWSGSRSLAPTIDELETLRSKLKLVESFAGAVAAELLRMQLDGTTNSDHSANELVTMVAQMLHDQGDRHGV